MNILSIFILLGLLVLLVFQMKNIVLAIKEKVKNKKQSKNETNQNIEKGDNK